MFAILQCHDLKVLWWSQSLKIFMRLSSSRDGFKLRRAAAFAVVFCASLPSSNIVHIMSSPCTMLIMLIMMTVWNVFSKPMTRIMFSNIGIIITLLLQIEMWTWLKGRTVKLNLFASHKSCFSVWAPSISTRPPLQKKQPCKYAGDKYKHADEDKSQITSLCRRQSNNQKYKNTNRPRQSKGRNPNSVKVELFWIP